MKRMKLLLSVVVAAICLATAIAIPITGSAQAQEATPVPAQVAQVETLDGQVIQLEGPFTTEGQWQIHELTVSRFRLDYLHQIERTDAGTFMLTTTDGAQVEGLPSAEATLAGEGEWGRETLPLSSIRRVTLEGSSPPPDLAAVDGSVQVETVSGLAFRLTDFYTEGELLVGSLRVDPDHGDIQTLERTGDWAFTAQAADGESAEMVLDEWATTNLHGNTIWGGTCTLPYSAIQRLIVEEQPYDFSPPAPASPVVQIEAFDGQTVHLLGAYSRGELQAGAGEWQTGQFQVKNILFDRLQQLERTGTDTFMVTDREGAAIDLTAGADAELVGIHTWGRARLPFSAIQRITIPEAQPSPTSAVLGTLELSDGSSWTIEPLALEEIAQPPIRSSDAKGIWQMLLLADPVEYWIGTTFWIGYGFSQQEGRFTIPCGAEPCPGGEVLGGSLRFAMNSLELTVSLDQVRLYAPATGAPAMTLQPRWSVTITGWDGQSATFPFSQLAYTRYPKTCWSGWYAGSPFHWYTDTLLPVIKPDGTHLDIDFERLARIEWPQPYDSQRLATVISTQGSSLSVTIFPGSTNEETKKGPASWNPDLEGLLGTVVEGYQVFIPLPNVSKIELNPPDAS